MMATMNRWDPFQDMVTLREAMSQLLEESVVRGVPQAANGARGFVPALDLFETPDGFTVEAAVPGLKPEDLTITVENNVLTISGEIRQNSQSKNQTAHRIERRFGRFQRAVSLPNTVQADAISASLEHGVLHLNIPKAEQVKPRRITVNVAHGTQPTIESNQN